MNNGIITIRECYITEDGKTINLQGRSIDESVVSGKPKSLVTTKFTKVIFKRKDGQETEYVCPCEDRKRGGYVELKQLPPVYDGDSVITQTDTFGKYISYKGEPA